VEELKEDHRTGNKSARYIPPKEGDFQNLPRRGTGVLTSGTRVIIFIPLLILQAFLHPNLTTVLHAQNRQTGIQGGTLTLNPVGELSWNGTTYVQKVSLSGYIGQPLKALQLRVISSNELRLRNVERGIDINNSSEWNLSHVIVHGKKGVDTAKVVIFGLGATSLPPREYSELLVVTYDVISSSHGKSAKVWLANVLGALQRGENAQIVAGPSQTVFLNNNKTKKEKPR
jgi:hypothetical protein